MLAETRIRMCVEHLCGFPEDLVRSSGCFSYRFAHFCSTLLTKHHFPLRFTPVSPCFGMRTGAYGSVRERLGTVGHGWAQLGNIGTRRNV